MITDKTGGHLRLIIRLSIVRPGGPDIPRDTPASCPLLSLQSKAIVLVPLLDTASMVACLASYQILDKVS